MATTNRYKDITDEQWIKIEQEFASAVKQGMDTKAVLQQHGLSYNAAYHHFTRLGIFRTRKQILGNESMPKKTIVTSVKPKSKGFVKFVPDGNQTSTRKLEVVINTSMKVFVESNDEEGLRTLMKCTFMEQAV